MPRPQLLARLDQQRERPLTLVSAPAGFGKSTLLSAWLERCAWRSAWLALDDEDDQLATFLACTLAAIQTLFPEFGAATEALLGTVTLSPVPVLVSSLINELDELDEPFVLVLDDYHVIHTAAIHDLWAKVLSHPPHALHLVLAVRHDPALPIDTLRARAAIGEIRSQDLRFSMEETQAFLQRMLGTPIDETQAALLQAKTEGWAAGLRLIALSSWHQNAASKLTELPSPDMPLMDYLAGEVLARQPAALQEVLLKTSILERLNNALCEAVTAESQPVSGGKTYLDWFTERNLFIQPLDDERDWFRYHHLFRQLLLHQLQRRYPRDEIARLHQRTSRWYVAQGLLEEAVQHALLADDAVGAAQIVIQHRHSLMNQDNWRRLNALLGVLPSTVIETEPGLLLAQAWSAYNSYDVRHIPGLIDRAEAQLAQPTLDPESARRLRGEIEFFRGYQSYWADDVPAIVPHMQHALEWIPLEGWHARVVARLFLASAYHMLGDSTRVDSALAAGLDEARNNPPYLMRSYMISLFIHWNAGRLQDMLDMAERVVALSDQHLYLQTVNWTHYFNGIAYYHRNQLPQAEDELLAVVLDRYENHLQCLVHSAIALVFTY